MMRSLLAVDRQKRNPVYRKGGSMNYQIFSENEWVYPDSRIDEGGRKKAELYAARRSDVCFQILTDIPLTGGEAFASEAADLPCGAEVSQLLPVLVSENSGPKTFTTLDYDTVKDFVTRRAPFEVYDITKPVGRELDGGRAAFYVRLTVPADAVPGLYEGTLLLNVGEESLSVPVSLKICNASVPPLHEARFHMVNWIYYPRLAAQYGAEPWSKEYLDLLGRFLDNELDMRNDCLMIPAGEPVRDEGGTVVDFDFTHAEIVGNLALKKGFSRIMGGFVARFRRWDDPDNYLLWDRDVGCTGIEAFRQLKLYFRRAWECVLKNGWRERYMQCLVDEPQFPNSLAYRALSGICRQSMPGVKINDPVETTEIAGACDVWVVKQAVYEKYLADFRRLQDTGEEMWIYTCGFPAGATMNRVLDLPLTVSRMPMWMCFKYGCPGFLHWGYHAYTPTEGMQDVCTEAGNGQKYPAGNAHAVYIGTEGPLYSVRGHLQRAGAQDYELFSLLPDREAAVRIIEKVCRTFDDYDGAADSFDEARRELLEALG